MKTEKCCIALHPHRKSGVIFCQPAQVEFMGPGALLFQPDPALLMVPPSSTDPTRVILLGDVQLDVLSNFTDQKKASWRRVEWRYWLRRVKEIQNPIQRIELLLQSFNIFFGTSVSRSLPAEVLALMIGCEVHHLSAIRDRYFQDWSWEHEKSPHTEQWRQLSLEEWQTLLQQTLNSSEVCSGSTEGNHISREERSEIPPKTYGWRKTLRKGNPTLDLEEGTVQSSWGKFCHVL